MRRIKLAVLGSAVAALAGLGLLAAPAAQATDIGSPPGTILHLCISIAPQPPFLCVYL